MFFNEIPNWEETLELIKLRVAFWVRLLKPSGGRVIIQSLVG